MSSRGRTSYDGAQLRYSDLEDDYVYSYNDSQYRHQRSPRNSGIRGRGILKNGGSAPRYHLEQQVDDIRDSLHTTNRCMSENERLLTDYRTDNRRRSFEMDELRCQLDKTSDLLNTSLNSHTHQPHPTVHFNVTSSPKRHFYHEDSDTRHHYQLMRELEKERLTRERAELERKHMLDLLDTSLRDHTHVTPTPPSTEQLRTDMLDQMKEFKEELMKTHSQHEESTGFERRLHDVEHRLNESITTATERKEEVYGSLVQEIKEIKDDLWKRDANDRQKVLLKEMKKLETDLSTKSQLLSTSSHHSTELATRVNRLGEQLDQVEQEKRKALASLEVTTHRLDQSLGGKDELVRKVEELSRQLAKSEEQRVLSESLREKLVHECKERELKQEQLSRRINDVEERLSAYRTEKNTLETRYERLKQLHSVRVNSESQLKHRCEHLQAKLSANSSEEEKMIGVHRKMVEMEQECSKRRVEVVQLRKELQNTQDESKNLKEKVASLQGELLQSESVCDKLHDEVRELSTQLYTSQEQKTMLVERIDEAFKKLDLSEQQRDNLKLRLSGVETQFDDSKRRSEATRAQGIQTIKRYKIQCKKLEQENKQVIQDKNNLHVQCEDLQRQLHEYHSHFESGETAISYLQQENSNLKEQVNQLQARCDELKQTNHEFEMQVKDLQGSLKEIEASVDQCQQEIVELKRENEMLCMEADSLKKELSHSLEQSHLSEDKLNSEVEHGQEMIHTLQSQLEHNAQSHKELVSKLKDKLNRTAKAYQTLRSEFNSVKSQAEREQEERIKLEEQLRQTQEALTQREQEISDKLDTLKTSHSQNVDALTQQQKQLVLKLQQQVTHLQLQLADEQSTIRALRRQQVKVFDDQQRTLQEDLTRSLEDTEQLKRKYVEAKRQFQEKLFHLESELCESQSEENASLKHQLSECQADLLQVREEYETMIDSAAREVDSLVEKMGKRVHLPMFSNLDETNTRTCTADMLAKLKWLQKEIRDLLIHEGRLRKKLRQHYQIKAQEHSAQEVDQDY